MAKLTAFDSKEFTRSNAAGELKFFTPLGCGATFTDPDEFSALFSEVLSELAEQFSVINCCAGFSPSEYIKKIGRGRTTRMSDDLLKSVGHLIESVYLTYVILPPTTTPQVEVGGYRSPKYEVNTFDFLRKLSGYFSYITAWNYLGIKERQGETIYIDGFTGNMTPAWEDITKRNSPIIYTRGDECNPFISISDVIAYLTDRKLWNDYLRLDPENIREVWKSYPFSVDTHFLDKNILSKIKWYSSDPINLVSYYARPIIFLKADGYRTTDIKNLGVFSEATIYACQKGGCIQGFDLHTDSPKVKDGDIFIYAGERAKLTGETLSDMYDIEMLSFKELREKRKRFNPTLLRYDDE